MFVINRVWHQVGWKWQLHTVNDTMMAGFLCLKSTLVNLKPGIAWQESLSVFKLSMEISLLQPISIAENFTLKPIYLNDLSLSECDIYTGLFLDILFIWHS